MNEQAEPTLVERLRDIYRHPLYPTAAEAADRIEALTAAGEALLAVTCSCYGEEAREAGRRWREVTGQ